MSTRVSKSRSSSRTSDSYVSRQTCALEPVIGLHCSSSVKYVSVSGEKDFADELARIGTGEDLLPNSSEMPLSPDLLVETEQQLIDFCYEHEALVHPLQHTAELLEAAILCPHRRSAERINDRVRQELPGRDIICESTDTASSENILDELQVDRAAQLTEHINSATPQGIFCSRAANTMT